MRQFTNCYLINISRYNVLQYFNPIINNSVCHVISGGLKVARREGVIQEGSLSAITAAVFMS